MSQLPTSFSSEHVVHIINALSRTDLCLDTSVCLKGAFYRGFWKLNEHLWNLWSRTPTGPHRPPPTPAGPHRPPPTSAAVEFRLCLGPQLEASFRRRALRGTFIPSGVGLLKLTERLLLLMLLLRSPRWRAEICERRS